MTVTRRSLLASSLALGLSGCAKIGLAKAVGAEQTSGLIGARALTGASFETDTGSYILADILAPAAKTSHGWQARSLLQEILSTGVQQTTCAQEDRWQRQICRFVGVSDGASIESALVAAGAVRAAPQSDNHAFIAALLAVEAVARDAGRGLWADQKYRVYDASTGYVPFNEYHLFEGAITSATERSGRLFLNFGDDYRTDVTASATSRRVRSWTKSKNGYTSPFWSLVAEDVEGVVGRRVLVRGYVSSINGPSVDLTHPSQIGLSTATV